MQGFALSERTLLFVYGTRYRVVSRHRYSRKRGSGLVLTDL